MSTARHRAFRRYTLVVMGVALLVLLAVGITNSTVNPWRVTPVPWQADELDLYRDQTDHSRTGKAGILRSGQWKIGLVGSSRVANAFDPELPAWGRKDVVNLGCNSAFLHETTAIARYFMEHEPVEMVLFGVDPGDLTSPVDTRPLYDFAISPFAPDASLDDELRYVCGLSTLESSLATLDNEEDHRPAEYTPKGMRHAPKVPNLSQLKFIASTITGKTVLQTTDAAGANRPLNKEKFDSLRETLRESKRRSCRMVVFFQSNHALMHAEAAHAGSGLVPFEKERRLLVELVAGVNSEFPGSPEIVLWDFCNYHPLNCEPMPLDDPKTGLMTNWKDLGHFTPEVGSTMLALMMDWPLPRPEWAGIGKRLDPGNLDAWLAETGAGYQRYLTADGARDLAWKEALKAKAKP